MVKMEKVTVNVIEHNLLIIKSKNDKSKLIRAINNNGTYIFPVFWILFNKLKDAIIIDESLRFLCVKGIKLIGIPSPGRIGSPIFSYLLLMLFGWIILSIPVLVEFELEEDAVMTLEDVKEVVISIINSDLESYEHSVLNRVKSAKKFESIISILKP